MRNIIIILSFILYSQYIYCQNTSFIGQIRFINAKITGVDTVIESICGIQTKATRLTILARTKVQLSCNYGDPSENIYDTINNKVHLYYSDDPTGNLHGAILSDINSYLIEQEKFAKQYANGDDSVYLNKGFFVNGSTTVPFIWTASENVGDYYLFYLNKHVYKIVLLKTEGLGCLSSFVDENIYFIKNDKKFDLGKSVMSIKLAKQIASLK